MGLAFSPISNAVLAGIAPADHAKANGANSTLREIGVALGIAVLTAVFTGAGGTLTPTGFADAAQPAVLVGAAVVAAGALLALLLPSGRVRGSAAGGCARRRCSSPSDPGRVSTDEGGSAALGATGPP